MQMLGYVLTVWLSLCSLAVYHQKYNVAQFHPSYGASPLSSAVQAKASHIIELKRMIRLLLLSGYNIGKDELKGRGRDAIYLH